jgi:hypothetical protein
MKINIKLMPIARECEIFTGHIEWEFQRRCAFLHIDIKHIVILLAIEKLLPPRADGIHDIANLLPV